jgi:hypothetical protein
VGTVWYLLTSAPRKVLAPRALVSVVAASLLGLAVYLYLPLRYETLPAFNYAGYYNASGVFVPVNLQTAAGLWWLVSGKAFSGEMFAYQGSALWREIGHFGSELWRAFFVVGVGPGLIGAGLLLERDWRFGGMLLLMFAASAGFYIDYRVVDKDTMFLPAYLVWALWLGYGYQFLLDWVRQGGSQVTRNWGNWLLRITMVVAVVVAAAWTWRLVDRSNDWSARQRGETILRRVERNALVLGWWDTAPVVEYLQLVEGQRPDVQSINRFLIADDDLHALIMREVLRRPVYIDEPPADLLSNLRAEPAGLVYRLRPRR